MTAVEWLANTLSKAGLITQDDFDSLVKQAKEMEAKQMYSEEEVMNMFHSLSMHLPLHYEFLVKEQFKKK